jgi:biotin operon repressor
MPVATRERGRGASLALAVRALQRLQSGAVTIEELGVAIGRGRRTAYRLIEVLEAQGLAIERRPVGREVLYGVALDEMSRWMKGADGGEARGPDMAAMRKARRPCSEKGCGRPSHAHGRCHSHDMRWRHGWVVEGPIRQIRRLNDLEAAEVRRRYVSRDAPTIAELASEYRVSRVTIWKVLPRQDARARRWAPGEDR